ncbi:hypothetical protein [Rummeliibacillus stabekisii]|uniref:hypothetical protein n=1 Tax=Rummeliibacillus stabekisii TaxID=241244 RepID=UPI001174F114|nr:hypothetical protein [Rummeliibacillus stabekisii]MBB5170185.1 hypothetical protein [Rummeliibacillus stabekisii]GEL04443.1 hypothetical protein RST01_10700 [Rummeliibacillus stabekisii]
MTFAQHVAAINHTMLSLIIVMVCRLTTISVTATISVGKVLTPVATTAIPIIIVEDLSVMRISAFG